MGINAGIFHNPLGNCSNGGISSKHNKCCIVNAAGPFDPVDDCPAVLIVAGAVPGAVRAVPAVNDPSAPDGWKEQPGWNQMGGDFVYSSDSRFSECVRKVYCDAWGSHRGAASSHMIWTGAIPLHDRQER